MAKLFDIMGNFPFKAEDKKPTLIRKSEYSTALYPPNNAFTSDNTFYDGYDGYLHARYL